MFPTIQFTPELEPDRACSYYEKDGVFISRYIDGSESSNWPLLEDKSYKAIAAQLGFSSSVNDLTRYGYEHEFCHHFVPTRFFGRASYVVWNSAHDLPGRMVAAQMEERMIFYFQRFLHGLIPIPDRDWEAMRKEALEILNGK